ncbi:MAG: nucleotidyltransferase domain-containing protein [Verrucomicrobiota bacterium]
MILPPQLQSIVEAQPWPLVFATISGAHLYGFPSPDSDFDLRGTHVLPVPQVVGLDEPQETLEDSRVLEGLEMDIVSHDARKFFRLLLRKNGYVLEQVLSPLVVLTTPEHDELKSLARQCVTRHHAHHYLGFAETQWKIFLNEELPRVKPLLYLYRVLLTGIHLMRSGEVEANLETLLGEYPQPGVSDLIERKRNGKEKETLTPGESAGHEIAKLRLESLLRDERDRSRLRELPAGTVSEGLNDLLIRLRLSSIGQPVTRITA